MTIKTHHNVGGLKPGMKFTLIEPLRELFKDEVRNVGRELGLPEEMVGRHPFPGPGLAIRVLGAVSDDALDVLRRADAIYLEEIRGAGLYDEIWQAFAVLLPVRSVGVMGDYRTYENVVALRAVTSTDGMTADWFPFPHDVLGADLEPHHQRGARGEPRGLRREFQAARDDRVGVGVPARRAWRDTLRELTLRPGIITRDVLDGQGGGYLPLGRLLVVLAAVFFAITLWQPGHHDEPTPEAVAACVNGRGQSDIDRLLGAAGASGEPAVGSTAAGLEHLAGELVCDPQRFTRALSLAVPVAFLLLLPLSAVLMQLAFRHQMPRFRDNWAYGLEAHAALFLLLLVLLLLSLPGVGLLSFLASVTGLFYATWNVLTGVERAYRVGPGVAAWRTTAVGIVYAVALTIVATLLFLALFGRV